MKCPNCGKELAEDTRFCDECGCRIPETESDTEQTETETAEIPETEKTQDVQSAGEEDGASVPSDEAPAEEKKEKKLFGFTKKTIICAATAAVLLLVIIIALCCVFSRSHVAEMRNKQYLFVSVPEDNTTRVYLYGKCIGGKQDFMGLNEEHWSDDGLTGLIIATDDIGSRALYSVGKKKIEKCDDDPVTVEAISPDGKKGVYLKSGDTSSEVRTVNTKTGKTEKIDEAYSVLAAAYSPNGKYLVYVVCDNSGNKIFRRYDGKKVSTLLETDMAAALLGVSSDGKLVYAAAEEEGDTVVYAIRRSGKKKEIGNGFDSFSVMSANGRQIIFNTKDGVYLSRNGRKAVKMTSGEITAPLSMLNVLQVHIAGTRGIAYYVAQDNLLNEYWIAGQLKYSLVKFSRNPDKNETLITNIQKLANIKPFMDGKTVLLFKDGELSITSLKYGDEMIDKAKKIVGGVRWFVITADEKLVYFVNDDNDLCVCKPVEDASYTRITGDFNGSLKNISGKLTVFQKDGSSYYGVNGKRKKLISDERTLIFTDAKGVYFRDDDNAYFYTSSLGKAKKVKNK